MAQYAYEIPQLRFSGIAKEEIPGNCFVAMDSTGEIKVATATDVVIGVAPQDCKAKEVVEIYTGIVIVRAEDAITPGQAVVSGAEGKAKAGSAGAGVPGMVAITKATKAGDLISVRLA